MAADQPVTPVAAVHGPYEDLAIEGIRFMGKLIDGQSVEQKAKMWQQWIDFWESVRKLGS